MTGVPPRSSLSPQNKERQRAPEKGETESQEKERAERNSNRSGWHREVVAVMALCHMSSLSTGRGGSGGGQGGTILRVTARISTFVLLAIPPKPLLFWRSL